MTDETTPLPEAGPATESSDARTEPAAPHSAKATGAPWWLALVLLALAAAAAYGLWRYNQHLNATIAAQDALLHQMAQDVNALEVQADRLQRRQADLTASGQRTASDVAEFASRIAAHDELVGDLSEELSGGRTRFQLAVVEQLLMLANDRLQLARDRSSALAALDAADARLSQLRDPRLFPVRQALAQERTSLRAVAMPDVTGAALTLASLIARVPRLPLAARVAQRFEAQRAAPPAPAADASRGQRFVASVREALSSLFAVRRNTGPSPRLLSAEQETLIVEILALKLEGARMALLRGDAVTFRDLCESAAQWLNDYFHDEDAGVIAAQAELARLLPLDLAPPLPEISNSLSLLRQQMEPLPQ